MHVLRLALSILPILVALAVVAVFFRSVGSADEARAPVAVAERQVTAEDVAAARQEIEKVLAAAPEYADLLDRLRRQFPADYEAFLVEAANRAAASGTVADADMLVFEAQRTLRAARGVLAAKASVAALDHVFELQRDMLRALALEDPRLCVDFLYGTADEGFFRFSARNRASIVRFAMAGMDAIADGQIEQNDRDTPTSADLQALESGLVAKGLDTDEIEAVLDAKMMDPPMEDEKLCRAGRIYLDVLAALPEASRMRLYALAVELMARS